MLTNIDSESNSDYDDVCFYNSLCSHFMFGLPDFNHVFSNIAYVALGALLVLITICWRSIEGHGHQYEGQEVFKSMHLGCVNSVSILLLLIA